MRKLKLYYDPAITIQALNYLAHHAPGRELDKIDALKLLYLADRDQLRDGGYRTILGDEYDARKFGPVARKANRLIEHMARNGGDKDGWLSVERRPGGRISIRPLRPLRPAHMDKLSKSDVQSLDRVLRLWTTVPDLVSFTHRFPEWNKHEAALRAGARSVRMDYLDFFLPCPDPGDEYCPATPELVALSREAYEESAGLFG